nr:putative protein [Melanopsichium pennsylvanicum 4]
MEKALQEGMDHEADNESFYSALSRSNSQRRDEVEGRLLHNSDQSESIVLDKAAFLHRSNSAPIMHFFKPDYQVSALHTTKSPSTTMDQGLRKQHQARTSSSPSRVEFGRSVSASSDHYGGYNDETNARLRAVEAALLDLKQHQYDSQKFSAFTKIMIGMGLLNAVGAGASAELSVQNAIEAAKKNYSQQNKLPDVTNLDPTTCTKFQTEVTGLDCSKAHGVKFA